MPAPKEVSVVLLGVGACGRALLRAIQHSRELMKARYNLKFNVKSVCDRSGCITEARDPSSGAGSSPASRPPSASSSVDIASVLAWKEAGHALANHKVATELGAADQWRGPGTILVDCTRASTGPLLLRWLGAGAMVVTANKHALTGSMDEFRQLMQPSHVPRLRYESCVGSGSPFIATISRLVAGGDDIKSIHGAFSCTLGYICEGLDKHRAFSKLVHEAYTLGYSEQDPRRDLSGMMVARRGLVIARLLGWNVELADVQVEALYPPEFDREGVTAQDFLQRLQHFQELDDFYYRRVLKADRLERCLRYLAVLENGHLTVGLRTVSQDDPVAHAGVDNILQVSSRNYNHRPLVIQGSGIGAPVTASGVLADMVDVALANV
eukprot:m.188583 g.188583  ORF g.188583 m.188583 type:complete len:381 (+) comp21654_c0_seq2:70-1212(+)